MDAAQTRRARADELVGRKIPRRPDWGMSLADKFCLTKGPLGRKAAADGAESIVTDPVSTYIWSTARGALPAIRVGLSIAPANKLPTTLYYFLQSDSGLFEHVIPLAWLALTKKAHSRIP
jgi:hypothetical protein